MEQNHLGNFGKGHYEEHFCEIILNLDQCSGDVNVINITFLILSCGGHLVQRS